MEELITEMGWGLLMSVLILFNFCIVVTPNINTYFSLLAHSLYFPKGQCPKNIPGFKQSQLGLTC